MTSMMLLSRADLGQALAVLLPIDAHAAEILDANAAPVPLPPIRLRVTGWRRRKGDGAWASMPVPKSGLKLRSRTTPSGHLALFDAVESADGTIRQPYFGSGVHSEQVDVETEINLTVDGDVYRPTTSPVALPAHDRLTEIRLRPNYRYPFNPRRLPDGKRWPILVRGRLLDEQGRGAGGMIVRFETDAPDSGYETDGTGYFVLVLPPGKTAPRMTITISRPGEAAPVFTSKVDVAAGEPSTPITVITLPTGSTGD